MKTKEELKALKEEVETLNKKLAELTDEELAQVSGGLPQELLARLAVDIDAVALLNPCEDKFTIDAARVVVNAHDIESAKLG